MKKLFKVTIGTTTIKTTKVTIINIGIETINVPFTFVKEYISGIYENFSDLFIPAEVIGTIIINELVSIDLNLEKLLITDNSNIVFGSNRDVSKDLSMRWAKDICFSEIL